MKLKKLHLAIRKLIGKAYDSDVNNGAWESKRIGVKVTKYTEAGTTELKVFALHNNEWLPIAKAQYRKGTARVIEKWNGMLEHWRLAVTKDHFGSRFIRNRMAFFVVRIKEFDGVMFINGIPLVREHFDRIFMHWFKCDFSANKNNYVYETTMFKQEFNRHRGRNPTPAMYRHMIMVPDHEPMFLQCPVTAFTLVKTLPRQVFKHGIRGTCGVFSKKPKEWHFNKDTLMEEARQIIVYNEQLITNRRYHSPTPDVNHSDRLIYSFLVGYSDD